LYQLTNFLFQLEYNTYCHTCLVEILQVLLEATQHILDCLH